MVALGSTLLPLTEILYSLRFVHLWKMVVGGTVALSWVHSPKYRVQNTDILDILSNQHKERQYGNGCFIALASEGTMGTDVIGHYIFA